MDDLSRFNQVCKKLGGRNLYLVGMMGSGKSRTGPVLAKKLSYGFVDVDDVIEKVTNQSISEIFDQEGEIGFREIETQILQEIGQRHSLVVATGGGIVTRPENWGILHQGVVIWIDLDREIALSRLRSDETPRPLLQKNLDDNFDCLFKERLPIYLESDVHLSVREESPDDVAIGICTNLQLLLLKDEGLDGRQTIEE
ncbi:shikimate kinase [Prochlorococcus marinus]|uniref:Shikimate kinase n=1 Tax=Prochlorococcus marinus (strain MIT 9211) TaxID=93059 RepID=AROK_PROM4|nr:shikimate kinase [Prochlorococcus marinus]A9BCW6.1 RecName: Full=Shikimate kinase; Short=SK [Prochlorococcus marinus str. MIT 9211]ABX08054.1 Shikimate kinase [Prochlorococcus marinus str. MIT 9211]